MKCIEMISNGNVKRVTNEEAHILVNQNKAKYISKNRWKDLKENN